MAIAALCGYGLFNKEYKPHLIMKTIANFFILCLTIMSSFLVSCSGKEVNEDNKDVDYVSLTKIKYEEDDQVFPNPERGFFTHLEFKSSQESNVISDAALASQRALNRTLIFNIYYLDSFMESPISEEYLNYIRSNMDALRRNGFKCVLRFAYNRSYTQQAHPWDASWEVVSGHIDQLTPIFENYADVIFCLEAGFIGTFGEWYYTDYYIFNPQTEEDYKPRKILLEKLMNALPATRQIAVRYPGAITKIYGIDVTDTLTLQTAHNGSNYSRTASHNDCFVSSSNDVGTYHRAGEREFVYKNTRYTIWGGETCAMDKAGHCENSLEKARLHHLTYLNHDYHRSVLNRWKEEGCYDEIAIRAGYRLVLDRAFITPRPVKGQDLRVVLKIQNKGFAAPQNPRKVELILTGPETRVFDIDADPRFWFENIESTLDMKVNLPADLEKGTYIVCLNLPDPEPTLHNDPRFSIRLANKGTWEEATGLNKITEITID